MLTSKLKNEIDLPNYTFRPLQREDLPALHALFLTSIAADGEDHVDSQIDLETQFDDPWSNPETDSVVGFTPGGELVAFGRCFVHPEPAREARCFLWPYLHPDHRSEALEDAVFGWLMARGRERLHSAPAHLERSLRMGTRDTLQRNIALLERHAFTPVRYFYRMRRDLSQPIPEGPLPEGLTLRRYSKDIDQAMLDTFNEAFQDHWGFEKVIREDWEKFFIGRESFRPDLSLAVLHGDDVVGISYNVVSAEDNKRNGRQEGTIGDLAVRRAWRKRGIASALICESMRLFRADGLDYAELGVDTENPTGALGLYEKLGFTPVKRFIMFDKPLT
jgi:ribosomal protein S18 acetylase RimI-like enzyme